MYIKRWQNDSFNTNERITIKHVTFKEKKRIPKIGKTGMRGTKMR